ncbi:hypothetical protein E3N88_34405 [Mikania micrantha]|uniref:Uncharacterized protein n=1 Tax=Mikania micrantha TaxID=192012 RepID=A0A5N6LY11_9ASTR|nr:hypothetical protein E3N88_34405 [Mikania micrantha]
MKLYTLFEFDDNRTASLSMESKTNTWSDQWGNGVFDNEEKDYDKQNNNKKKMEQVKSAASTGLVKAKSAAIVGAHKVKKGTSTGFKWIKDKCSSSK